MLLTLVLLYPYYFHSIKAAPIQNTTVSTFAPAWVADPSGRGTWSILYSCVFTLTLCVWTSVHINVPGVDDSQSTILLRKAKWVVIGLLAPEAVVFAAFQQWLEARYFLKELQRLYDTTLRTPSDSQGTTSDTNVHKFDMAYAYFVVMGGFIVDIEHIHNTTKYATLTTNSLLLLAQHGHFHYVPRGTIEDKSKANFLAKGLVCVQVLWVVGQAIERKVSGFPISLLEYHTLVHVFCALIMYSLWLQKPYDIQKAVIVSSEGYPKALAFIVSSWRKENGFISMPSDLVLDWFGSLLETPQIVQEESTKLSKEGSASLRILSSSEQNDHRIKNHFVRLKSSVPKPFKPNDISESDIYHPVVKIRVTHSLPAGIEPVLILESGQALASGLGPRYYGPSVGDRIELSQKDVNRLDLAGDFIKELIQNRDQPVAASASFNKPNLHLSESIGERPIHNPTGGGVFRPYGDELIYHRILNWPDTFELYERSTNMSWFYVIAVALLFIPGSYGAIHLAALNYEFPTRIELLLWKNSCYILIGSAGFWWATMSFIAGISRSNTWYRNFGHYFTIIIEKTILLALSAACLTLWTMFYISARAFLVIESFISLRRVPTKVYETPDSNFMSYIPHL